MATFNVHISHKSHESYFEYILSKSDCSSLKNREIMYLLEKHINKFSGGDSSVSKLRAQSLIDSIVYVLSIYLKQYTKQKAIAIIKEKTIEDIYKEGLLWIKHLIDIGTSEVSKVQSSMIITDYVFYNETLKDGLDAFIKNYDYQYNSLDNVITYDYPLIFNIRGYVGIERFFQYLMYIKIENSFCKCFTNEFIKELLCFYRRDYQNYIFNISELLLTQMLLSAIINHKDIITVFDNVMINQIYKGLENKSKIEIFNLLMNTYYDCMNRLNIDNQKVIQYLRGAISDISSRVYYSCLYKTLEKETSYVKT
ncbi:MAG: DUF6179 domain-containing protein [Coprobacillus sp.]